MSSEQLTRIENKLDLILTLLSNNSSKSESSSVNDDTSSTMSTGSTTKASAKVKKPRAKKGTAASGSVIKRGNIKLDIYSDIILVTGETYDRKDLIKSLGGKWNATYKGWTIPASKKDDAISNLETYCLSVEKNNKNSNLIPLSTKSTSNQVNNSDINSDVETYSYNMDSD